MYAVNAVFNCASILTTKSTYRSLSAQRLSECTVQTACYTRHHIRFVIRMVEFQITEMVYIKFDIDNRQVSLIFVSAS
jgi:hypothetical protein